MPAKLWDPDDCVITIAGHRVGGFGENSMVSAERDEQAFLKKVGSTGEVARARNRNRSGSVTFTLLQTSASNDFLSTLAALDEASGTGSGPLQIQDLRGTTLIHAPNAWVQKVATFERGKEINDVEWVIDCDVLEVFHGGATRLF